MWKLWTLSVIKRSHQSPFPNVPKPTRERAAYQNEAYTETPTAVKPQEYSIPNTNRSPKPPNP